MISSFKAIRIFVSSLNKKDKDRGEKERKGKRTMNDLRWEHREEKERKKRQV
jgi:hypothetical protein